MFINSPALTRPLPRERAWGAAIRALLTRPRSLRAHMATLILLALALPLAVQLLGGMTLLNTVNRRLGNSLQDTADSIGLVVTTEISDATKAIRAAGSIPAPASLDELEKRARLLAREQLADVLVWRNDGQVVGGSVAGPHALPDEREAAALRQALAGTAAVLVSPDDHAPASVTIFVPVTEPFVLQVTYPVTSLVPMLAIAARQPELNASCLVDAVGMVIAGQATGPCPTGAVVADWLKAAIARQTSGIVDGRAEPGGVAFAAFATPTLAPSWRALAMESKNSYGMGLQRPAVVTLGAAVLSLMLAIAAAMGAGALLSRSLRSLTAAAQGVAGGAESLGEVAASPIVEFNELRVSVARADAVLRRRAAAERLALREARTGHELLASVVNATADLIYVKDLNLRFVLANRAALIADWIDRDEWQVLGRREADIIEPEKAARLEALDREVLASGELRSGRIEWPHADGSWHLYAMTKTPWRDAAGAIAGVVTVVHDITDQRHAEQRLAGIQGELLRATRLSAMGEMASGLAHELNQPLAAATNFLNATAHLLSRPDPIPVLPLVRSAVTDAAEQTLRAGAIVRRLRDFVGRGEADLNVENLGEIVGEIRRVACADGAIDDRELVVQPGDPDAIALVERTQIQQVLLNLIKNASEAIGGKPGGRITLSWRANASGVEIAVADNGPGLAADIRSRLFQPFTSTKTFGMGIGLAICRTIVEGHGGRLYAEDNPGGGALFRIVLPPATNNAFDPTEQQP